MHAHMQMRNIVRHTDTTPSNMWVKAKLIIMMVIFIGLLLQSKGWWCWKPGCTRPQFVLFKYIIHVFPSFLVDLYVCCELRSSEWPSFRPLRKSIEYVLCVKRSTSLATGPSRISVFALVDPHRIAAYPSAILLPSKSKNESWTF